MVQQEKEADVLALYAPSALDAPSLDAPVAWQLAQAIPLQTTAAQGLVWSPDGQVVAVWDHMLEYRVLFYSITGMLLATFRIAPEEDTPRSFLSLSASEARTVLASEGTASGRARRVSLHPARVSQSTSVRASAPAARRAPTAPVLSRVAGGGLGVRCVAWHPSSALVAVGGYDERVRILSREAWTEVYTLDARRSALEHPHDDPVVWREPRRWFEATQGQGMVAMEQGTLPADPPMQKSDEMAQSKYGVHWMAWNRDGSLLAVRNEAIPTTLFVYQFDGLAERRVDVRPCLVGVLLLASPIQCVSWKPNAVATLAVVTGKSSVYLYTLQSHREPTAEAVAIPNGTSIH